MRPALPEWLETAYREAALGMSRSLDRADKHVPGWSELALDYLTKYARGHEEFPGYFVTLLAEMDPNFPDPPNQKAWGGVWKAAVGRGIVKATGRTIPHPKRHGCPAVIWASLVYGQ